MKRFVSRLTYANVMATIAVFIALGGASYAATQLPKNSVGAKQLKKRAVTPTKLSKSAQRALTGAAGPKGPKGDTGGRGEKGEAGPAATPLWAVVEEHGRLNRGKNISGTQELDEGFYEVEFYQHNVSQCDWQATVASPGVQSGVPRAVIGVTLKMTDPETLYVEISNLSGAAVSAPFHLAVFC